MTVTVFDIYISIIFLRFYFSVLSIISLSFDWEVITNTLDSVNTHFQTGSHFVSLPASFLKCDRTLSFVSDTFYLPYVSDSVIDFLTYVLRNALSTYERFQLTPSSFYTKLSSNDFMLSWLFGFHRSFKEQSYSPKRLLYLLVIFVRTQRKTAYYILSPIHTVISTVSSLLLTTPSPNRIGELENANFAFSCG